MRAMKVLIFR